MEFQPDMPCPDIDPETKENMERVVTVLGKVSEKARAQILGIIQGFEMAAEIQEQEKKDT